ncbi:hypothetical protein [Photobacterium obscurum]|nr:hypothetical protein [Photobacterium obscurum]
MNTDMMIFCYGLAIRFPQANRPIQGRGHWRHPVNRYRHPEQK